MKLTDFKILTFDCYGTLIDWESGILNALRPWIAQHNVTLTDVEILKTFAKYESEQEMKTPRASYQQILIDTYKKMAKHFNIQWTEENALTFGRSVKDWPAFTDSLSAMQYLKNHYQLVILSNVDRASFSESNKKLGVIFDAIFTAQDIGSYKPDQRNFDYLLAELAKRDIRKNEILHVAQSLFHDHVPAKKLGLATCWVNRRNGQEGWGATLSPPTHVKPDFEVKSLNDFVKQHNMNFLDR